MKNTEITTIEVGKEFNIFKESNYRLVSDGAYFEALDDNDGFMMVLYLTGINPEEKELLDNEIMRTRMIRDNNKVLFLIQFGDSPLIFEASFDPTLYKDKRAMQITFNNHMVTFVTVERFDNKIKSMRMANFPMKLKQALITSWTQAFEEENYSANYTAWLDKLYTRYSTYELWQIAEPTGFFGEGGLL